MENPVEQIENITNIDDFLCFLTQLSMNAKEHPEEWANQSINDYLGQIASWIDDEYPFNDVIEWDKVDYKTLAKILYMGKIYE